MGGGGLGRVLGRGQGGCEGRIEVIVKIQKKNWGCQGRAGGGGGRGRVVGGGQGGCDRRIEVFGIIHKKKSGGGSVWGCSGWGGESGWM